MPDQLTPQPTDKQSAENATPPSDVSSSESPTVQKLAKASEGLRMPSEADFPFLPFFLEAKDEDAAPAPETLPEQLKLEEKAPASERSLDDFLGNAASEEDWMEDDEKAEAKKFQSLLDTLKAELKEPTVHLFGERKMDAVIIGRVEGGFAGLVTTIVET